MGKYTIYFWHSDDEGGVGVCLTKNFTPKTGYHPETGWRAQPSMKIGEFDTLQQLDKIIETNDFLSGENVYDIWDELVIPLCEEDMGIDEIENELDNCYEEIWIIDSKINNLLSEKEEIKEKIERLKKKLAETA